MLDDLISGDFEALMAPPLDLDNPMVDVDYMSRDSDSTFADTEEEMQ